MGDFKDALCAEIDLNEVVTIYIPVGGRVLYRVLTGLGLAESITGKH